jgi:lysophospholipid acyltransferase
VYERVTPKGKRPTFGTLVATQLVSGVWHGLFPGYWLFFATTALMFEAGKTLYR